MTEAQFGLLTSALFWAYGLMSPVAGFLADRFSRSRIIVISMFAWCLSTWLMGYATSFHQLVIFRTLIGVCEAFYLPTALALISDYHPGSTRSLATGIHNSGYVFGIGVSGAAGWLADQHSSHYVFVLIGLAGMAYSIPLYLLLRDKGSTERVASSSAPSAAPVRLGPTLRSLFSHGSYALTLINWALVGVAGWAVFAWVPVFLQEHFHLSQGRAGLYSTVYMNAGAIVGMIISGAWADYWSRSNTRGRMYVAAIGFLFAGPGVFLTATSPSLILAVVGLVSFRLFFAFVDSNMMPILCEIVDPRFRATAYGILNCTGSMAAGVGIYVSGALRDGRIDLSLVYKVVAGVCLLISLIYYLTKPQSASERNFAK